MEDKIDLSLGSFNKSDEYMTKMVVNASSIGKTSYSDKFYKCDFVISSSTSSNPSNLKCGTLQYTICIN